jgi:hypothetical protein
MVGLFLGSGSFYHSVVEGSLIRQTFAVADVHFAEDPNFESFKCFQITDED